VKEWIESALKGSGWTFNEVMEGVERGDFFVFSNDQAAIVCEYIISPRHKVFHCWAAGGDKNASLEPLEALVHQAEAFAILNGCDSAGGTGRKGWVRAMRNLGYTEATPAVEKEL